LSIQDLTVVVWMEATQAMEKTSSKDGTTIAISRTGQGRRSRGRAVVADFLSAPN
jgi:hypothetical protein